MTTSDEAAPPLRMRFSDGVPANARCLEGHFPDNPIVPGAVLLGYAANVLRGQGLEIASVSRMKFQRPLLPETAFEIDLIDGENGSAILWRTDDSLIAQARVTLRADGG